MSLMERFEAKINFCPTSGCWLWGDSPNGRGYGHFSLNGKVRLAHRLSWEIYRGPIGAGLFVCHKCDVRECVNPDHLFLGTCKDNLQDMGRKGRSAMQSNPETRRKVGLTHQGELSRHAKLTRRDAEFILNYVAVKRGDLARLARVYGISQSTVTNIRAGQTWPHLKREV